MKNYNKKYKKRKRGKVKAQSRNEFRKHKPSGHYKYVFLKTNKGYKFLGITHSDKASNYGPVSNPDPKSEDPRPVYVETEWEEDSESHFDSVQKTGSVKERPVVVIESKKDGSVAVVPLSSRKGNNRTNLKKYQDGQSYFKHYVEIEDDEGRPIKPNSKFRENHPYMDVAEDDVDFITNKVLFHSRPSPENRRKMDKFRNNKKSPQD